MTFRARRRRVAGAQTASPSVSAGAPPLAPAHCSRPSPWTLQLNFAANGRLTWRRRVAGSGIGLWRRWGRFHLARGAELPALVARARRQRALLVLVTYYIPGRGCSSSDQKGAATARHYRRWIDRLVDRLGSTRAAVVVEPDAIAADGYDTRRAILLKHSVRRLAGAGHYVYLSDGICGGETTYLFSPTQARRLTVSSPFLPAESCRLAAAADVPPTAEGRYRT
jgi:Glycosyl hydrolases family 6